MESELTVKKDEAVGWNGKPEVAHNILSCAFLTVSIGDSYLGSKCGEIAGGEQCLAWLQFLLSFWPWA